MRVLIFKKGKALDKGVRKGDLIFLKPPLCATHQSLCPFMDPPNNPSHVTKALRLEQAGNIMASRSHCTGFQSLKEHRTTKGQTLRAKGPQGAEADGLML